MYQPLYVVSQETGGFQAWVRHDGFLRITYQRIGELVPHFQQALEEIEEYDCEGYDYEDYL